MNIRGIVVFILANARPPVNKRSGIIPVGILKLYNNSFVFGDQQLWRERYFSRVVIDHIVVVLASHQLYSIHVDLFSS